MCENLLKKINKNVLEIQDLMRAQEELEKAHEQALIKIGNILQSQEDAFKELQNNKKKDIKYDELGY